MNEYSPSIFSIFFPYYQGVLISHTKIIAQLPDCGVVLEYTCLFVPFILPHAYNTRPGRAMELGCGKIYTRTRLKE